MHGLISALRFHLTGGRPHPKFVAALKLMDLYAPLQSQIIVTDLNSAELIKYGANSFLAMKISFINAVATMCESVGADVRQVCDGGLREGSI